MVCMSLFLLFALAQTTTCTTSLGVTTCNSTPGLSTPTADPWQIFRDQQTEQSRQIQERNRLQVLQNEAAAERRAKAYAQVGELIAAGKCDEAKRLAAFYGLFGFECGCAPLNDHVSPLGQRSGEARRSPSSAPR